MAFNDGAKALHLLIMICKYTNYFGIPYPIESLSLLKTS